MVPIGVRKGFGVLFLLVVEECVVASVLGLLEAREADARERVEDLREAAAREAVPVPAPVPGGIVLPWREGPPATTLAPDYQRILSVLQDRPEPVRAKDIAVALGLGTRAAKVEGGAVEGEALGGARVDRPGGLGDVHPVDEAAGVAAVGPDQSDVAVHGPQTLEHRCGRIAVGDVRGGHSHQQEQAERVGHEVPLRPGTFFPPS